MNGFSDDEACYGEEVGEGDEVGEGGNGLDLFAAMLGEGGSEKRGTAKTASRKRSNIREFRGSEGSKRRKVAEKDTEVSKETADSANDEVDRMKGRCVCHHHSGLLCKRFVRSSDSSVSVVSFFVSLEDNPRG